MPFNTMNKHVKAIAIGLLASSGSLPVIAQQTDTIDVMVLYTSDAAENRNGAIETYINSLIATSNTTYSDSEMRARIRLVHSQQLNVSGSTRIDGPSLSALKDNAQVNELRAEHGADLVALLNVARSSGGRGLVCGIGYVAFGSNGRLSRFAKDSAYSISGVNCGATTFTHELGHNMGLGHSRRQGSRGGVVDSGVGYGVDGLLATTMAYSQVFGAPRVQRFSNPNQTCAGVPCGVSGNGSNSSDAVSAVDSVSEQIANYFPSKTSPGNTGDGDDPATGGGSGNDIISNGDFETATAAGWESAFGARVNVSNEVSRSGNYSLEASNRRQWYDGIKQRVTSQIENNSLYELSAWVRINGNTSQNIEARLYYRDNSGHNWRTFDTQEANTNWVELTGQVDIQANGEITDARLYFFGPRDSNNFYLDDVVLKKQ